MAFLSDILMISGALGVAFYCIVLSRRLRKFTDLEKGVGGAIAVLSSQVDDMTKALKAAQTQAAASGESLGLLTRRAEGVARRIELQIAAMHDLPSFDSAPPTDAVAAPQSPEPKEKKAAPPVRSFFSTKRVRRLEPAE